MVYCDFLIFSQLKSHTKHELPLFIFSIYESICISAPHPYVNQFIRFLPLGWRTQHSTRPSFTIASHTNSLGENVGENV